MHFHILTLFPEVFGSYLDTSIVGRARSEKLIATQLINIRDFATDKHKTVDDTPYGGGAGMVMKIEPIDRALHALNDQTPNPNDQSSPNDLMTKTRRIVVLSARGQQFTQAKAREYAQLDELVLICGRYEGIDQRVADYLADEEISIGPYVLAGGEIAALAVLEATARLLPGVLGNEESLLEESFHGSLPLKRGGDQEGVENITPPYPSPRLRGGEYKEYPQYTKPADYKGWKVPEVLLSGNHEEIRRWRSAQ